MQDRTVIDLDEVLNPLIPASTHHSSPSVILPDSDVWEWDQWVKANEEMEKQRIPEERIKAEKKKAVKQYYEETNEIIDARLEAHKIIMGLETGEEVDEDAGKCPLNTSKSAAIISFCVNVCLVIVKVIAVSVTGSISVISSLVDSGLDLFSGFVLYLADHAISKQNPYDFPVGKSRFEPIAVVVIACVMGTAALQVIFESITRLADNADAPKLDALGLALLLTTIVAKTLLFLYCRTIDSASARALATDHSNDIISNSLAVGFTVLANKKWAPADPIGAILISLIIIVNWVRQGKEHSHNLVGKSVGPKMLQLLTFISMYHHPEVENVDTVRAYQLGNDTFVEVDISLHEQTPLHSSHNIGESLQRKLEMVPGVERAFVHLDYSNDHNAEYEHKIVKKSA